MAAADQGDHWELATTSLVLSAAMTARGQVRNIIMRSRLLATTAVLVATIAIAAAQSNPQGGAGQSQSPGASPGASGGARGQENGAGQAQDRAQGQDKG